MRFAEVVGQEELKEKFVHLVKNNHLPHAIMMLESEGSGGFALARAVAQFVMCTNKQESDSCGECASCKKVSNLQHPDLHFSFPFNKTPDKRGISNDYFVDFRKFILDHPYASETEWFFSQGKENQGNIPAEECRDILRKLQMRPYENGFKIMLIWKPEYLGKEGNILLKFIEEPTSKTLLFFITEDLKNILPTIQSRAQLFPLKRLTTEQIKQGLMQNDLSETNALQIARLADGNYRKAQLLQNDTSHNYTEIADKWLSSLFKNNGLEILSFTEEISKNGKEAQKNFIIYIIQLLEHLVRYQQLGNTNLALLDDEVKVIESLITKRVDIHLINDIAEVLNNAVYYLERNANSKLLFHGVSLRIQQLILSKKTT